MPSISIFGGKEKADIENEYLREKRALEIQVAAAETEQEILNLKLQLETLRVKHEIALQKMRTDALRRSLVETALLGIGLFALLQTIRLLLAWGWRKATTVYPNQQGIFPLVIIRDSWKRLTYYDANRDVGAVTTIEDGKPTHYLPPGQAQVTGQAQMVQLAAAVSSGERGQEANALAGRRLMGRPLPQVERAPWTPSHVERLLIESGELEDVHYDQ
jgi:hypothetical protein